MPARMSNYLVARFLVRSGCAIWPVACDRIESIGHGEYASVDVYLFAAQARRVSAAVVFLVVLGYNRSRGAQEIYTAEDAQSMPDMLAHTDPLVLCERATFEQYRIGPAYFAYVVQQRSLFERDQLCVRQPEFAAKPKRVCDYAI